MLELKDIIEDSSTSRLANLFHFIIYEARNTQIFHKLRISVNNVGTFSEVLALVLKDYHRLKESDELREVAKFSVPGQEDLEKAQKFFLQHQKDYIRILLARASAPCFKGRCGGR